MMIVVALAYLYLCLIGVAFVFGDEIDADGWKIIAVWPVAMPFWFAVKAYRMINAKRRGSDSEL